MCFNDVLLKSPITTKQDRNKQSPTAKPSFISTLPQLQIRLIFLLHILGHLFELVSQIDPWVFKSCLEPLLPFVGVVIFSFGFFPFLPNSPPRKPFFFFLASRSGVFAASLLFATPPCNLDFDFSCSPDASSVLVAFVAPFPRVAVIGSSWNGCNVSNQHVNTTARKINAMKTYRQVLGSIVAVLVVGR